MTKKFTVQVVIEAKNKATAAFKQFKSGFEGALNVPTSLNQAMDLMGNTLGNVINQIPQLVGEMAQLGIQSEGASRRFTQFAGSSERAASLLESFNAATDGTVDKITAMNAAGRLLQMGLVQNENEMGAVAEMATKLGNQTTSASDRIADFAALLANQSIPRLDNFGISSGKVRNRIKELQAATKDLSREEAFKIAVMEEGRKSLDTLGDTSDLASTKIDKLKAAIQDAKIGIGELIVESANGSANIDELASRIRMLPDTISQVGMVLGAYGATVRSVWGEHTTLREALDVFHGQLNANVIAQNDLFQSTEVLQFAYTNTLPAVESVSDATEQYTEATKEQIESLSNADIAFSGLPISMDLAEASAIRASEAIDEQAEALKRQTRAAQQAADTQFSLSLSFTDFTRRQEEATQSLVDRREELEQKHQDKIAEIQKKGQSRSIRLNVSAEQEKLVKLQENLEIALLQQEEFTAKTKESTLRRKEIQIADLQERIASQTQLLSDFHAGRLVQAGQNVDGLLAEEQRQHDESIALLEDQMAQQEETQRLALGRMVLQSFDSWAQMKGVTAERALEMRTAISQEYGLIDSDTATLVNNLTTSWEQWAEGTNKTTGNVIVDIRNLTNEIDEDTLPSVEDVGESGEKASDGLVSLGEGFSQGAVQAGIFDDEMERSNELLGLGNEGLTAHNELRDTATEGAILATEVETDLNAQIESSIGLITDSTVAITDRTEAFDGIVSSTANLTEQTELLSSKLEILNDWFDELPEEKTIKVKVDIESSGSLPGNVGIPALQHGGSFRGAAIVGEGGQPEMVFAPGGATVVPMNQLTTNNNFNMTVNTGQQAGSVIDDFEVMQALAQ
jgi:hypothetical protein